MNQTRRQLLTTMGLGGAALALPRGARAQKKYDPGASDTEIKIGNTMPYSSPLSSAGTVFGGCLTAFFKMINAEGGINGRRINFISYDDAYSPPKTVEQTRKLVESDRVLFIFCGAGTPTQSAVLKYMNEKKVPQLFIFSGANKFADPKHFPWTIPFPPNYEGVGRIYASYILAKHPVAKIGVLYQNDDFGKDYLNGLLDGLGGKAASLVKVKVSYETTDPTVDSQIVQMNAAGCDVFLLIAIPKFEAQAIRKVAEIEWKPLFITNGIAASVGAAFKPAGLENCKGIVTDNSFKDPTDPEWKDDAGYNEWAGFMDKYYPNGDKSDNAAVYGPSIAATTVQVLKQCGDELTRENVMRQAANLHNFALPMLQPGITINTSPTEFVAITQVRMERFYGQRFQTFGPVLSAAIS